MAQSPIDNSDSSATTQFGNDLQRVDSGIDLNYDNSPKSDESPKNTEPWDAQYQQNLLKTFDSAERTYIDTKEKLEAFLPTLLELQPSTPEAPELALDCEGRDLGRAGTVGLFQMRIRSQKHSYVFDVVLLGGKKMFENEGAEGQSLKEVLESKEHTQLWWDLRQDQDAMYQHFGIVLANNCIDLQLMELAARNCPQMDRLCSLSAAVAQEGTAWMSEEEIYEWGRMNKEAKYYFRQSQYKCFEERPLTFKALEYSAGDVDVIEELYNVYHPRVTEEGWFLVRQETKYRLEQSMAFEMPRGSPFAPNSFASLPIRWASEVEGSEESEVDHVIEGEENGWEQLVEEDVPDWERRALETSGQPWDWDMVQEQDVPDFGRRALETAGQQWDWGASMGKHIVARLRNVLRCGLYQHV